MPLSVRACLEQGIQTSKSLQQQTGLSQASVSRQLLALGDQLIRLSAGRTARYALARDAFGSGNRLALLTVDSDGNDIEIGCLRPLYGGGYFVEPEISLPTLFLGCDGSGLYQDLPWFLNDVRPQGFLGRQIAAALPQQGKGAFPADPRHWTSEQIGRYLIANGDDLPGNLKFGHSAYSRVRRPPLAVTSDAYPALADSVLNGTVPGSSAGGEQPKFTAFQAELNSHVIVKFSPRGNDRVAQRWRDILLTEYHAQQVLRDAGYPTAQLRLIEAQGRLFLESKRFDRVDQYGRLSMFSLQMIDAEFCDSGGSWVEVAQALHQQKQLSQQHLFDIQVFSAFGRLINNTDMHLGNLSLAVHGDMFQLVPLYDMCSMGFAPRAGEVLPYQFSAPDLVNTGLDERELLQIKRMAHLFWHSLAQDPRISEELRMFVQPLTSL